MYQMDDVVPTNKLNVSQITPKSSFPKPNNKNTHFPMNRASITARPIPFGKLLTNWLHHTLPFWVLKQIMTVVKYGPWTGFVRFERL
ncbi:MAG: hypothetical protein HRU40_06905 [Saprospiraceae bacterium]|nr:hypothetical protein [Saprospiraceae bacterium]